MSESRILESQMLNGLKSGYSGQSSVPKCQCVWGPLTRDLLYMLHDCNLEMRHLTKTVAFYFSPRSLHVSVTADSFSDQHDREPK